MQKVKIIWPKKKDVLKEILLVAAVSSVFVALTMLGDTVWLLFVK